MNKNFKFTQQCEINNIEFEKGDIIGHDQGIGFFGDVMTTTDEVPTITIEKASKVEAKKVPTSQPDANTDPKPIDINKLNKDQLIEKANEVGAVVVDEDTKKTLIEKIVAAELALNTPPVPDGQQ